MTQAAILAASGSPGTTTGFKNRIINGQMFIWQRATSLTTASNQVYGFADRWLTNAGASTTWSQSTDVPAGFKYSVSCAGSTFNGINQRIESFNCSDLAGQSITVSFWAKQSSGSSSLNINLAYANSADNFSSATTIVEAAISATPSSSWTRYSYTYVMPAGVVNGLQIILFCAAAANTTLFTGCQLEVGATATNFDFRSYGTEFGLCNRYYIKLNDPTGNVNSLSMLMVEGSTLGIGTINTVMRTSPTSTFSGIQVSDGSSLPNVTSVIGLQSITNGFGFTLVCSGGGLTSGKAARVRTGSGSASYLDFSAEL